jgi:homoserine dehydrogenase
MKTIKVGMLGIGNVGSGTYKALEMNCAAIEKSAGVHLEITKILNRRPEAKRAVDVPREKYTPDPYDIINDPEIQIVTEVMGGIEPATTYMADALRAGKHVVTANKAALAVNGQMLQQLAMENHVMLRFEASVGGGIPIINAIADPLVSNQYDEVLGILNGTTNYILTSMTDNGADYAEVLKDAQAKGLAEADPTADVEGLDVANKLSILISLLFGKRVLPQDIPTQGITAVSSIDINYATEFGYKIKLLARAKKTDGRLTCSVEPTLLPLSHPMAAVSNEFNAVYIRGNAVDELMFYGKGAGPLPTGSAVLGDIIDIANCIVKGAAFDVQPLLQYDSTLEAAGEGSAQYYLRMSVPDQPGVLGSITSTFAKYGIGIQSVMQRAEGGSASEVPLIFIIYRTDRRVLNEALAEIRGKGYADNIDAVMRVQER